MTTEQLILQELKKLTQKVDSLEKELNDLKSKFGSVPSYPFGKPHFDGPNPHNPFVEPLPLAPYEPKECAKCGLKLDNGPLSYTCPNNDCPCGMGPTTC